MIEQLLLPSQAHSKKDFHGTWALYWEDGFPEFDCRLLSYHLTVFSLLSYPYRVAKWLRSVVRDCRSTWGISSSFVPLRPLCQAPKLKRRMWHSKLSPSSPSASPRPNWLTSSPFLSELSIVLIFSLWVIAVWGRELATPPDLSMFFFFWFLHATGNVENHDGKAWGQGYSIYYVCHNDVISCTAWCNQKTHYYIMSSL